MRYVVRHSVSAIYGDEDRLQEAIPLTMRDIFYGLDRLATRFQKPIIVASDKPFAEAGFETMLWYTLGKPDYVYQSQPHEAFDNSSQPG